MGVLLLISLFCTVTTTLLFEPALLALMPSVGQQEKEAVPPQSKLETQPANAHPAIGR
jgi:hypothetical protein